MNITLAFYTCRNVSTRSFDVEHENHHSISMWNDAELRTPVANQIDTRMHMEDTTLSVCLTCKVGYIITNTEVGE